LQNAIDEIFRLGGGRVVVGSGFYSIKGIRLRSRVTLHLERGAVLQASRNAADFDILGKDAVEPIPAAEYERGRSRRWSPPRGELERTSPRLHISDPLSPWNDAVIRIRNAEDVAITGEVGSVIDGANGDRTGKARHRATWRASGARRWRGRSYGKAQGVPPVERCGRGSTPPA